MEKKNITPNPAQPVDRFTIGQLPNELAQLSEETLPENITGVFPSDLPMWWFSTRPYY